MTSNSSLQARRVAAVPRGVATAYPVFAGRAESSELWDVDGKRYIDFAGGIAVLNTGHRHPKVIAAVREQLDDYTHTAFQIVPYEPYIALCERLNALAPFTGEAKTILFSTGAEAVENAVKIARAATGRTGIIAFSGALPRPHHDDHGADRQGRALQEEVRADAGAASITCRSRCRSTASTVADSLRALELLFRADVEPAHVAAIIIEPVQGEGGFHPAPAELLQALRKVCDEHGILLIADEIQTGFARTGKMFGIENSPASSPTSITIAKSLAGGFPLSGVIGRAAIMDAPEPGGLGGTYAGSPIACAAALAVLDVIEEEKLIERANVLGDAHEGRPGAHRAAQRHGCRCRRSAGRAPWSPSTSSRRAAATSRTPTPPSG